MMSTRKSCFVLVSMLWCWCVVSSLDNGLGRTPQMGWNSWNHFGCNINEKVIMNTAKTIASSQLKTAGYIYVNIDDCWAKSRASNGTIIADDVAFPSGIKALADYVHSLGLKFGIYSDAGTKTCAGRPASLGYEKNDADTYAAWGVDYLKYDNCNSGPKIPEERYPIMRDALNATGRPIFFSLCEWGVDRPAEWAKAVGNSWRTTNDIEDQWISMLSNIDYTAPLAYAAAPGGWNDPDMLEVGNGKMSTVEYQTHFSLWAISKAPLIIGNDVTNMSPDVLSILTNTEVIGVNQDSLGIQAKRINFPLANASTSHVIISDCKGTPNQRWTINSSDKTIRSVLTGTCLDLPDCSNTNGIQVGVFPCHVGQPNQPCNNQNQQWDFNTDGSITSVYNKMCLNVWYNAGPPVIAWQCNGKPGNNEKFKYNTTTQALVNSMVSDAYYGGCLTVQTFTDQEIWAGPVSGGAYAVALVNRGDDTSNITVRWQDIGIANGRQATVRDLWAHKDLGSFTNSFSASVVSHGTVMVKIVPK